MDKVINQNIHNTILKQQAGNYSKYPPAFNIDIHIDDAQGVAIEGQRYHFKTIIVQASDAGWTDSILQEIDLLKIG